MLLIKLTNYPRYDAADVRKDLSIFFAALCHQEKSPNNNKNG